jgi:hypothetical protein
VWFDSAGQRRKFAEHIHAAVLDAVRQFTSPRGRPHRLVLGCTAIPPSP